MQRRLAALVGAGALTLPVANAASAAAATPVKKVATKTFKGIAAQADQWGTVQVTVTVRTTTIRTGTRKKVIRKYTDLGGSYSYHTSRSQYIMSQSLPYLRQEFLQAQSADVQMVSGATYTSQAFLRSLQSALLRAKRA
jgi:uncharacterized protein with FMN-binding domain